MFYVIIMDVKIVYNYVLENVGVIFFKRDVVDVCVMKMVKIGKVIYVKDVFEFVSIYVKRCFFVDFYK